MSHNTLCRPKVSKEQPPKQAVPPESAHKAAPKTGRVALKCLKSSFQNRLWRPKVFKKQVQSTLCRPKVLKKQFPKQAVPPRLGAVQNATFELQKAPGHDLVQKGRFPLLPEKKLNSRPKAVHHGKFEFQKAPGHDLAQKCRFSSLLPEDKFTSRPGAVQNAKFEL